MVASGSVAARPEYECCIRTVTTVLIEAVTSATVSTPILQLFFKFDSEVRRVNVYNHTTATVTTTIASAFTTASTPFSLVVGKTLFHSNKAEEQFNALL